MALGAVLHHQGHPCEGGSLQGSDGAQAIASDPKRDPINLSSWQHLQTREGGFAAYKGSLINLGLFLEEERTDERDDAEDSDEQETVQLTSGQLSVAGEALAQSFANAVKGTSYLEAQTGKAAIAFSVLNEFGSRAGLCELRQADGFDLEPLRDLFFAAGVEGTENSHYRRRMSLLLAMHAASIANANGLALSREVFDDLTFYRRLVLPVEEKSEINITIPEQLDDIADRWRIFHFQSYLTVALESLLAGLVRSLRGHPAGLTIAEIFDDFDTGEVQMALAEQLGFSAEKSFWQMTPADALARLGIEIGPLLEGDPISIERLSSGPMIECQLRTLLIGEGLVRGPTGPAIAAMLLFTLGLRFTCTVEERHQGWNRRKVVNQHSDVSLPGLLDGLQSQFGDDWWHRGNREILAQIMVRYVIRQHEAMSYERGFGGSPPLFHLEAARVVGNDVNRDGVDPGNARFPSIVQILRDLRLIEDRDSRQKLTEDGQALLGAHVADYGA